MHGQRHRPTGSGHLKSTSRRSWWAAVGGILAVGAALLAFQPVRGPWWTGVDNSSYYVGSSLTVFGGGVPTFTDHPGLPLQELLAATFAARWLAHGAPGSRERQADRWFGDLEGTRPYFRSWSVVLYLVGALLVGLLAGRALGSPLAAFFGGALFLGAPGLIPLAVYFPPDALLATLSMVAVFLARRGWVERDPWLYAGAATVVGYAVTLKVHAAALAVPVLFAAALRPPGAAAMRGLGTRARSFVARRRRAVTAVLVAYVALIVLLNAGSAVPDGSAVATLALLLGTVAAVAAAAAAVLVLARRRPALAAFPLLLGAAFIVGVVLPNLFYAGSLPAAVDGAWTTASTPGRVRVEPFEGALLPPRPWLPLVAVAAFGLARSVREREWSETVWAVGAVSMGAFAAARLGLLHYWAAAIVLLIPLVLRGLIVRGRFMWPVAVVVGALLFFPYERGTSAVRAHARNVSDAALVNRWLHSRLAQDEVALSGVLGSDWLYFVNLRGLEPNGALRGFVPGAPERTFRIVPADGGGVLWARRHGRRLAYLVPARRDPCELASSLGLRTAVAATAMPGVYELRPGTCSPR